MTVTTSATQIVFQTARPMPGVAANSTKRTRLSSPASSNRLPISSTPSGRIRNTHNKNAAPMSSPVLSRSLVVWPSSQPRQ